ncbi:MAG: hypothetical protein ACRDGI_01580 [Candidatus Limnocylindrales bacterium]
MADLPPDVSIAEAIGAFHTVEAFWVALSNDDDRAVRLLTAREALAKHGWSPQGLARQVRATLGVTTGQCGSMGTSNRVRILPGGELAFWSMPVWHDTLIDAPTLVAGWGWQVKRAGDGSWQLLQMPDSADLRAAPQFSLPEGTEAEALVASEKAKPARSKPAARAAKAAAVEPAAAPIETAASAVVSVAPVAQAVPAAPAGRAVAAAQAASVVPPAPVVPAAPVAPVATGTPVTETRAEREPVAVPIERSRPPDALPVAVPVEREPARDAVPIAVRVGATRAVARADVLPAAPPARKSSDDERPIRVRAQPTPVIPQIPVAPPTDQLAAAAARTPAARPSPASQSEIDRAAGLPPEPLSSLAVRRILGLPEPRTRRSHRRVLGASFIFGFVAALGIVLTVSSQLRH